MTDNRTEDSATDDSTTDSPATDDPGGATDRVEALEASVDALAERVAELERTVAWMARQQAAKTGRSACPECKTGGALTVSRTPAGKKQVECNNCGEKLN